MFLDNVDDAFKKEIIRYIEELSRVRTEHITALLSEYLESEMPDPFDVVLVEEHRGLQTIWYFSTKQGMEMTGNEIYNK